MTKHRVVVLKFIAKQLTVTEATSEYGISRWQLHRLLARYRLDGLDAVETAGIIATNTINPDRNYWRNNLKEPGDGRALSDITLDSSETYVPTHHIVDLRGLDSPTDTAQRDMLFAVSAGAHRGVLAHTDTK